MTFLLRSKVHCIRLRLILPVATCFALLAVCAGCPARAADWRLIAQTPVESLDIAFSIKGSSLSLNEDPVAILAHYRALPEEPELRSAIAAAAAKPDTLARADQFLSRVFVYGNYPPVSLPDLNASWSQTGGHDRSWSWLHHQLAALQILIAADSLSPAPGSSPYLKLASELTFSWALVNYSLPPPSPMSWHDHATAYRLRNLMWLFEQARTTSGDPALLILMLRLIYTHAEILSDEAFYARHTNHGFDQSAILYWMAVVFPEMQGSARLRELALRRLEDEIAFMFTTDGAHVENSPTYHFSVLGTLEFVANLAQTHGDEKRAADMVAVSEKAWRFMAASITPQGKFALVGDTIDVPFPLYPERADQSGYSEFLYAASQGRIGTRPEQADQVYPLGGYAMFRDAWHSSEAFAQGVFVHFKAGFLSQFHRQDDDLSLLLEGHGEAWLVDSGRYNYEEKDPMRLYVRSAAGHNTIIPRPAGGPTPKPIRLITKLPAGTGIIEHELSPAVSSVTGQTTIYPGYKLQRRLEFRRPCSIRLQDRIQPDAGTPQPGFALLFHIPKDKQIAISSQRVHAEAACGAAMEINFSPAPHSIRIETGQREPVIQAWTSRDMNLLEPTQCVIVEYFPGQATAETQITLTAP